MTAVIDTSAFIRAAEVWIPGPAGETLIRADGFYGPLKPFGEAAEDHGFIPGEGLPGRAWKEGRPILMTDLSDPAFARAGAAGEAGLAAAAAIPVFSGAALKGVLVLFFGEGQTGAVEIWRGEGTTMTLDAGFYGVAEEFRRVSEATAFERGQGLPGGVWGARAPILMRDLASSAGFLRAASAKEAGLSTGLGVPVAVPSGAAYALTLLSSRATPIARRFELWDAHPARGGRPATATLADGLCDIEGPLWQVEREIAAWQGPVGRALANGCPVTESNAPGPRGTRYAGMVALPLHEHGEVTRVVAWYF